MKNRNVKIAYSNEWKKSKIITNKEPAFYSECTISLLKEVPNEVSNKELIERWDNVSLTPPGNLRYIFHYHELLDAETTAKETYRVEEHNKLFGEKN